MSLDLNSLRPSKGANKNRRRIGRGPGSGRGKTSGRGHKGQKSRTGHSRRIGFEGGQMPLYRRLPKRGFTNIFAKQWAVINVGELNERFEDGDEVSLEALQQRGLANKKAEGLRVLGGGELEKKLTIRAFHFSKSARAKIDKAGGEMVVLKWAAINVGRLNSAFKNGDEVTPEVLLERGLIPELGPGLRIRGGGQLTKKLTVKAHSFNEDAKRKIEEAGGTAEVMS